MDALQVVVGLVFNSLGQILVALRPEGKPLAGLWEFPGGKLLAGEDPYLGLCRELHEEVGIQVQKAQQWLQLAPLSNSKITLDVWKVIHYDGDAYGREQQIIRWLPPQSLRQLNFPPANEAIVAKLLGEI